MAIELYRIDDRLIHGQVVVGWGQPLDLAFIVLVDDEVAASEWEQELYRMGIPPDMHVYFESVDSASVQLATYQADDRAGLLLTADIVTMTRLVDATGSIPAVNIGGIHHRSGRRDGGPDPMRDPRQSRQPGYVLADLDETLGVVRREVVGHRTHLGMGPGAA